MFWTGGVVDTSPQSPAGGSRVCLSCLALKARRLKLCLGLELRPVGGRVFNQLICVDLMWAVGLFQNCQVKEPTAHIRSI